MAERQENNEREKVKMIMITNIRGDQVKKVIDMRLNARLMAFIELYEQIFEIDLYAYKMKFIDRNTGREINNLLQADRSKGQAHIELYVEAPGG